MICWVYKFDKIPKYFNGTSIIGKWYTEFCSLGFSSEMGAECEAERDQWKDLITLHSLIPNLHTFPLYFSFIQLYLALLFGGI